VFQAPRELRDEPPYDPAGNLFQPKGSGVIYGRGA